MSHGSRDRADQLEAVANLALSALAGVDQAQLKAEADAAIAKILGREDEARLMQSISKILAESARREAEVAGLRASELECSSIVENAATGFALTTTDGQWARVNDSFCKTVGYSAEELLSMSWQELTFPEDLRTDDDTRVKLLSGEAKVCYREKRYVHKLGHPIWVHLSISLFRDACGKPIHFITHIQDISERKAAENELRTSNDLFRLLSESMPQMVWTTLPDGQPTYTNKLWIDYTGLGLEDGKGEGWTKVFHPDELEKVREAWGGALSSGNPYSIEARLRRNDGTYHWWLIRGLPLRDGQGRISKWVGTCTDIDELKRAFEKAKAYEELIAEQSELINQAKDAIVLMDLDSRIKFWNRGAARLYGWTSEEAVGRTKLELYANDAREHHRSVELLLKDGQWEGVLNQRTRSGAKISVETRWTLSRDAQGRPKSILSISTDVTERAQAQAQVFRAQRMESLGTLAGGIAHDLNNVLTPIMMSIELLKLGEDSPERLETLETIDTCSRRGADMISKVLSFARGMQGDRNNIDPKHLLREIERIANDTFLKSIQIEVKRPAVLWNVSGDATQLHQVLLNLCLNARDAMPSGGVLTLSADNVALDEKRATAMGGCTAGDYVLLSVQDTGTGMSKEVVDRAFEPFFTTKELGKGTGLGLSTSLAIIKSHQGFIRIYSEEGHGARFDVYLPAAPRSTDTKTPTTAVAQPPRGSGECILVVDDEDSVRQITRQTLETFGYRVKMASGGEEAVAIYAKQREQIVLVLTDMMMPRMDGIATIEELRKINPDVRVIAASGLSSNRGRAGEKYFLEKPYTAETLLRLIRKALDA